MRRTMLNAPMLLLLLQAAEPQREPTCLPCGDADPRVATVRDYFEEAFVVSMTLPDCDGAESRKACRQMEGLLEDAFAMLDGIVADGEAAGSIDCVTCDPTPHLSPLFMSFETLAQILVDRGYTEFVGKQMRMQQEIQLWKGYSCCGAKSTRARPSRNREMNARSALNEKCGANFEKNRSGLKQVVRMPDDDHQGCFQSRACRDATQHNGQFMEGGFWTYDGEYWYVWTKRRTPRGDWVDCNP